MAANNYYNFTHGGTQYGTQYTPGPGGQGYATGQPYGNQAGGGGPQGQAPQGYGGGGPGDQYILSGYARPVGQQQAQPNPQGYYTQPNTGYPGMTAAPTSAAGAPKVQQQPGPPRPAATSTVYPTYSANTAGTTNSSSYAGFAPPPMKIVGASFTNYDAAVYNAVSQYAQGSTGSRGGGGGGGGMSGFKKGVKGIKGTGRPMPKPQTLHYCDVCKISCAGPQTYKEHLEGQKHKKKEAAQKTGTQALPKGGPAGLRCELCDVTCTGSDAYAAHIRGAKHQKVLKLHTKLGKPIPSDNPTVISTTAGSSSVQSSSTNSSSSNSTAYAAPKTNPSSTVTVSGISNNTNQPNSVFAKPATPKINFMGNKDSPPVGLNNVGAGIGNESTSTTTSSSSQPLSTTYAAPAAPGGNVTSSDNKASPDFAEKDVQPVGQDYIEELKNEEGKVISFNCKLCECRFNDPNAKEMHMKGRRHRLQYKKKVNPHLIVDVKPSSRQKKIEERRGVRTVAGGRKMPMPNEPYARGPPVPLLPPGAGPRGVYGGGPGGMGYGGPGGNFFMPPLIRRPETMEDRHVMAKHAEIYPEEEELQAIQKIVSDSEKALKMVSDKFTEEDCKKVNGVKVENASDLPPPTDADLQAARILKGVMRVGHLAKGLLLKGDRLVELVVLCSEKPTVALLERVYSALPSHLEATAPDEKYELKKNIEGAGIVIASTSEPKIEVKITLTSPVMRGVGASEAQATTVPDPHDVLDKEKCLDALAALRHAKWFQARATALQSCVIVIRILRDLCQRAAAWNSLSCWAIELLTEKAINSAGMPISPGEALRIVLEVISSGLLLPVGPGLLDPCEKESCDAIGGLPAQAREDITAFAQQALRQVAFRQIHKVLDMEPLPRFNRKPFMNRKRRRDHSGSGDGEEVESVNDGKKDKKEEAMETDKVEVKSEVIA